MFSTSITTAQLDRVPPHAVQKTIYFFERGHPGTLAYHQTITLELVGDLDLEAFRLAVHALLQRHEMLHRKISETKGQVYLENIPLESLSLNKDWPLKLIDASQFSEPPPLADLTNTLTQLAERKMVTAPFTLTEQPLWRCALLQFPQQRFQFLFVGHHLIVDGSSKNIILRDLSELYNSRIEGREPKLSPLPALEKIISSIKKDPEKLNYWKETLKEITPLKLRTDFEPDKEPGFNGQRVYFDLDKNLSQSLVNLATQLNTSMHRIFLSSLYVLLYRYSNQNDICIGTVSANRRNHLENVDNHVSSFASSLPIFVQGLNNNLSFIDLLKTCSSVAVGAYKNQLPFDTIVQEAISPGNRAKLNTPSPFDIIFDLIPLKNQLELKNLDSTYPNELNLNQSKFYYFGLNIDEHPDNNFKAWIEFNTAVFTEETIQRIFTHLNIIWMSIAKNPQLTLAEIDLLSTADKKLIAEINNTENEFKFRDLTEILAEVAAKNPKKPAIINHKLELTETSRSETIETLSYQQLLQKSTALAQYLQGIGVGSHSIIGVSIPRSLDLFIAMWAIWIAGGIFVPVETESSPLLVAKIQKLEPDLIIVTRETFACFPSYNAKNIVNLSNWNKFKNLTFYHRPAQIKPEHTAYLTHTSGTTGLPKAVKISRAALTNLAYAIKALGLENARQVLCVDLPTFDAFHWGALTALMSEGTLHLPPEPRLAAKVLVPIIATYKITDLTLFPEILELLPLESTECASLRSITPMGDVINNNLFNRLKLLSKAREHSSNPLKIYLGYGPSENTVATSLQLLDPDNNKIRHTSIGKPLRNIEMYILDSYGNLCPVGVPGEVCLAGFSLSQGYDDEELTRQKFFLAQYYPEQGRFRFNSTTVETEQYSNRDATNKRKVFSLETKTEESQHKKTRPAKTQASSFLTPAPVSTSARALYLYKTGDLAYYNSEGYVDFISRADRQVKIYGVRIELLAIENILKKHPKIKDARVTFNKDNKTFAAFLVLKNLSDIQTKEAEKLIKQEVAAYLRNSPLPHIVKLNSIDFPQALPLNANGKVDMEGLLPTADEIEPEDSSDESFTPLQKQLRKIWAKVLNIPYPSIKLTASFEELGGDSLSIRILESIINEQLLLINQTDMLWFKAELTIESLAKLITPIYLGPSESLQIATNSTLFGSSARQRIDFTQSTSVAADNPSTTHSPSSSRL